MSDNISIGPGAICECCHDDANGIIDGLCPSCAKYAAELKADNARMRKALEDVLDFSGEYQTRMMATEALASAGKEE